MLNGKQDKLEVYFNDRGARAPTPAEKMMIKLKERRDQDVKKRSAIGHLLYSECANFTALLLGFALELAGGVVQERPLILNISRLNRKKAHEPLDSGALCRKRG